MDIEPQDETIALLQQAQIDPNEYLRFRITERFNTLLKAIYEERKRTNEELSISVSDFMKQNAEDILKDKEAKDKGPVYCVAKTLGLDFKDVPKDKLDIFEEVLTGSDLYKLIVGQTTDNMSREQRRKLKRDAKKQK